MSCLFSLFIVPGNSPAEGVSGLLPSPLKSEVKKGKFCIGSDTVILIKSAEASEAAGFLRERLKSATGLALEEKESAESNYIIFTLSDKVKSIEGSYELLVTPSRITLAARGGAGFFYAVHTMLQLGPPELYGSSQIHDIQWSIPCVSISDTPKYAWRSFMLDSGRQYQSVSFIKRYLDYLAMLKINVFHWHLTEGEGWRIEIKQYPHLTDVGAKVSNGPEQQGFYTQKEIREIVSYAQERYITVVPEIDVPGHSAAALIAYPEYTCFGKPPDSLKGQQPFLFCAGNEKTYEFLENVLDEVCDLFPSPYVHLGGDEAPKDHWDKCPKCQAVIKQQGLKDSHELQLFFSAHLAEYLKSKGKKAIFWGDVVYTDSGLKLPEDTVIYWWNWRGKNDTAYRNAIKRGLNVICGTNCYCYLNYPVTPWSGYGKNRTVDLKDVYNNNPSHFQEPHSLVLGMGCCLWTDYGVRMDMIDRRVFPRIYALVEQMWHCGNLLSFEDFYERIKKQKKRMEVSGIHYGPALKEEVDSNWSWE